MKLKWLTAAAVNALLALTLTPAAFAQTPPAATTAPGTVTTSVIKLHHGDRKFVENATAAGMAEVAMAKVAQERGGSAGVKSFADRMVADHEKANRELASIAAAKGVSVPDKLLRKDAEEVQKLHFLDGAKFDKEYIKNQLAAHKEVVKEFLRESKHGRDADLKRYAGATLPMLKDHLAMVTSLAKGGH